MTTLIHADWPAPENIQAFSSTCLHGQSKGPYASNNLALHVDDLKEDVLNNRKNIKIALNLIHEPAWLNQTHSTDAVIVEEDHGRDADASITRTPHLPLVILTADCLPILICNQQGTEVAAIHAGWRGLLNGIIQNTLSKMQSSPADLMAWIGPSICQRCYEVGPEVQTQFTQQYPFSKIAFEGRHANLPYMAELVLHSLGLTQVYQSHRCTFEEKDLFYSYRRAPQTGRIGTFIWFQSSL